MVLILGAILIGVGLVATVAGIAGGIATMFLNIRRQASSFGGFDEVLPTELVKALTEFLKGLTNAPQWLALTVIGLLLIGAGSGMIGSF